MGLDSIWHWAILLVIILLVFGTGKLTRVGSDLGNAVRGFKKAMNDGETEDPAKQIPAPAAKDAEFPEVAIAKTPHPNEQKAAPHA